MLDTIGKLSIDLQALSVETEYSQIRNMLINWVGTDIAVYCQNMSASISQNNSEKAQQAILGREVCYNDMATLTTNMVSMGNAMVGFVQSMLWLVTVMAPIGFLTYQGKRIIDFKRNKSKAKMFERTRSIRSTKSD